MLSRALVRTALVLTCLAATLLGSLPVAAAGDPPVDIVLLVDDSCSMFSQTDVQQYEAAHNTALNCSLFGSDETQRRLVGVNVFLARLGFAEPNEASYQIGVSSFGNAIAALQVPLTPLNPANDRSIRQDLATQVASRIPQNETQIAAALDIAYNQFKTPQSGNARAIVLLTDGLPYPDEQTQQARIAQALQDHPDIQLFVMLLNSPDPASPVGRAFWAAQAAQHKQVVVYPIANDTQIIETYHDILGRLQNRQTARERAVSSDQPLKFTVNPLVKRVTVTISHPLNQPFEQRARIELSGPNGVVDASNPRVQIFRSPKNNVEVINVADPTPGQWVLRSSSTTTVNVLLDTQGSYVFAFSQPQVVVFSNSAADYRLVEPVNPLTALRLRFTLNVDDKPYADAANRQPITGDLTLADGTTIGLNAQLESMLPAPDGTYELALQLPNDAKLRGDFTLSLKAGVAYQIGSEVVPIARANVRGDLVIRPEYANLPGEIICAAGQPAPLDVALNYVAEAGVQQSALAMEVTLNGEPLPLSVGANGHYGGNLKSLCAPLLSTAACGSEQTAVARVRLTGTFANGAAFAPVDEPVQVRLKAGACAAPALATAAAPTPSLAPQPVPAAPPALPLWQQALLGGVAAVLVGGAAFLLLWRRRRPPLVFIAYRPTRGAYSGLRSTEGVVGRVVARVGKQADIAIEDMDEGQYTIMRNPAGQAELLDDHGMSRGIIDDSQRTAAYPSRGAQKGIIFISTDSNKIPPR